jgi:tRNA A-37 threonylcarbamoyl transferase component Bud32
MPKQEAPAVSRHPRADAQQPYTVPFHNTVWHVRRGFETLLQRTTLETWRDPAAQGWRCVKENNVRTVWRAEIGGKAFFCKYYYKRGWRDELKARFWPTGCRAEWQSALFALRTRVPVVEPVGCTFDLNSKRGACAVLVTEAAEPAVNLNSFWQTLQTDENPPRRRSDSNALIDQLAALIARAHQAGLEHTDMHAENILVQQIRPRDYRTLFVDLQSTRRDRAVSDAAVVRNLAQLNQWFRRHAGLSARLRFLRAYLRHRETAEYSLPHARQLNLSFRELVRRLRAAAETHAERLARQRDRRIFRSGRYFTRIKLGDGWRGFAYLGCKRVSPLSPVSKRQLSRAWWEKQLKRPELLKCDHVYKDSHSGDVRRLGFPLADGDVLRTIYKRPLPRNWRRKLRMMLGRSRSRRGWKTAHALLHRHLPTPRPLAFVEQRRGLLVRESFLLTEALPDALDLEVLLRRERPLRGSKLWRQLKNELAELIARRLRELHATGVWHRDCKASNILILPEPELSLLWTDLDGLKPGQAVTPDREQRALVRLAVSGLSIPGVTRTDAARLLRAFHQRFGIAPTEWRNAWRRLAPRVEAKQHAVEARRAWKRTKYGRE